MNEETKSFVSQKFLPKLPLIIRVYLKMWGQHEALSNRRWSAHRFLLFIPIREKIV
jgi:hypothetical protein